MHLYKRNKDIVDIVGQYGYFHFNAVLE
jgi:hypothetical protein